MLVVLAVFECSAAVGAEPAKSELAVASSSSIATGTGDLEQRMILHHVLEQGRAPLISRWRRVESSKERATSGEPTSPPPAGDSPVHVAVRPDGIDGWRPASSASASSAGPLHLSPLESRSVAPNDASRPQDSVPDDGEPVAEEPRAEAADGQETELLVLPNDENADGEVLQQESESLSADDADESDEAVDTATDDLIEETAPEAGELTNTPEPVQTVQPPPLTRQLMQLRSRVRSVLKGYYRRMLNSREHDPWEVMHGMLAYGVHSNIRQGSSRGAPITSVGWLCYNKPCKGQTLLRVTPEGELRAKYGVGLQGHLGQLLAMLAQCRVSEEYPIRVGRHEFTIRDLIEAEKKTCYPNSELTFKLIALQHYLDLNERWVNDQGLEWDFPRLIREELAQPIRGAACGGTHRLSGLSLTVKARVRRGEPLDGEYGRAAEFVHKYHRYAFRLQNRDGSLSTAWFKGRGDDSDINRRIKTTGHILEWLCYSLSDEDLRDPQTIRSVSYLANLMYHNYDNEWEVGPMSHAIHALLLYDERVFQPFDTENNDLAYKPRPKTARRSQSTSSRR